MLSNLPATFQSKQQIKVTFDHKHFPEIDFDLKRAQYIKMYLFTLLTLSQVSCMLYPSGFAPFSQVHIFPLTWQIHLLSIGGLDQSLRSFTSIPSSISMILFLILFLISSSQIPDFSSFCKVTLSINSFLRLFHCWEKKCVFNEVENLVAIAISGGI